MIIGNKSGGAILALLTLSQGLINASHKLVSCSFFVVMSCIIVGYIAEKRGLVVATSSVAISILLNLAFVISAHNLNSIVMMSLIAVFSSSVLLIFLVSLRGFNMFIAAFFAVFLDTFVMSFGLANKFSLEKLMMIAEQDLFYKLSYFLIAFMLVKLFTNSKISRFI